MMKRWIIMTAIRYLQMNHILAINVSLGVDMPLNKPNLKFWGIYYNSSIKEFNKQEKLSLIWILNQSFKFLHSFMYNRAELI